MSAPPGESDDRQPDAEAVRLTADLDVDVCVVGGGLAGLTVAIEAARHGASVALLEARRLGCGASGCHLGTVQPGFDVSLEDLIARVGRQDARALWQLSQDGTEHVRAMAGAMPVALSDGALQVSNIDAWDRFAGRVERLNEDFGIEASGWQTDRVRETLRTQRYFQGLHFSRAFQLDAAGYLRGLRDAASAAGVRVYEDTPVVSLDASGVRKRVTTHAARVRAGHVVLAGNAELGRAFPRLAATLLPIWRYAATTAPLGDDLSATIAFPGSVIDTDGIDHFRIVAGNRLMWSHATTTWPARPQRYRTAIERRIRAIFPRLAAATVETTWSGVTGHAVHGMPQIGELRPGLWVASGFGRQGIATSATAALLISRGILWRDDRWRLLSPFDLVWAGGRAGRLAGHVVEVASRGRSAAAGFVARHRERAKRRHADGAHPTSTELLPPSSQESERERDAAL